MTTTVDLAAQPAAGPPVPRAGTLRLIRSELRWVLRRPRTLVALGLLALVPVAIGVTLTLTDGIRAGGGAERGGPSLLAAVAGNGLVLPVAALSITMVLLMPLVVSMAAADALAGEAAHGTLRGLLLAPVGRVRLVMVKAVGVLVVAVLAAGLVAVTGWLTGMVLIGGDGLVTLSGTTVPLGTATLRVALVAGWVAAQMAAVGAVALAISAATDHPLVVMAASMAGLILFGVLRSLSALDWLHPVLLTEGWISVADVLRDPMPTEGLLTGLLRAGCYVLIGLSVAVARTATREG
ncbi:ABC-2 type transport system permease protein [Streptoalloteichus tenebrarius]|uniref:ABC-2 type transport system permease protein n=1 Tax=Streptoalloteichus tenebrarius (strain ATCC 17920 / DSM 40477 / JCM 4838 / CBS 697.72 / NBRC 16177 / NCIMB 11028 / NRRL B-12390 / A12253. 1 / ISP 5477) TaxID=1933 RepID=A0ABT1I4H6_STRSD|nr:ABC transporter permease subunit [Streptoalloteichus tenebrarius]MCP2262631.1 ABC-2 type transport system permease protein [Streptoalloteichus tenebrarius]BFF01107.1 ABC transporter permease subunit [Streptoalloteichus tenebrarius]